jgi:alpha-L-fucosidase 2
MPIHPLGTISVEGSDRDRQIIAASLKQLDALGPGAWCGFSFAWRACLAARTGDPATALSNLNLYLEKYISRNGFDLNFDYRKTGSRPFTLETNFAAAQAVHEMLLQSWGGVVRVFPAVPEKWAEASFDGLRAEGAFIVTARREKGQTASVKIVAEKGGLLRLRDPFAGKEPKWSRAGVKKVGANYECTLEPGAVLEGRATT